MNAQVRSNLKKYLKEEGQLLGELEQANIPNLHVPELGLPLLSGNKTLENLRVPKFPPILCFNSTAWHRIIFKINKWHITKFSHLFTIVINQIYFIYQLSFSFS